MRIIIMKILIKIYVRIILGFIPIFQETKIAYSVYFINIKEVHLVLEKEIS